MRRGAHHIGVADRVRVGFDGADLLAEPLGRFRRELVGFRHVMTRDPHLAELAYSRQDRKSTRLNSSHSQISYAVFCLKKKTTEQQRSVVEESSSGYAVFSCSRSPASELLVPQVHLPAVPRTPSTVSRLAMRATS